MNTPNLFSIAGKVALVTGGAHGMGRMTAEGLLLHGATVYITARKQEACDRAVSEMRSIGPCHGLVADLGDPSVAKDLARRFGEKQQQLDLLINNAGRSWGAPLEKFPDEAWPSVFSVNVQAPFALVRELLPQLRAAAAPANPARVINIGSIAGSVVEPISAYSYAASKAAIHHLSKVLAADLAKDHITVNCVVPGYFPTRMTAHLRDDEASLQETIERIPLARFGEAEDIVGACVFLASRAGAYVTGAQLVVDGGMSGTR